MAADRASQDTSRRVELTPVRRAQLGLATAAVGAVLLILALSDLFSILAVVLAVLGTALATTFERRSHGWWALLVAGTVLALLSPLIARVAENSGGLIATTGSTLILVAVVLAFPVKGEAP